MRLYLHLSVLLAIFLMASSSYATAQELVPKVQGSQAELQARLEQLLDGIQKLPPKSPKKPSYLINIGHTYYTLHKYRDAASAYKSAEVLMTAKHPLWSLTKIMAGECYEKIGDTAAAMKEYQACSLEKNGHGAIARDRCLILKSQSNDPVHVADSVIQCSDNAIDDFHVAAFREAMTQIAGRNKVLAKKVYAKWFKYHPNHYATPMIAIEFNRLDFPIGTERSAELKRLVAKYHRRNAASVRLRYDLGMAYMHEGKLKEALDQFDLVLSESKGIDKKSTFYSENVILSAQKTKAIIQYDLGYKETGAKTANALIAKAPKSYQATLMRNFIQQHKDEDKMYSGAATTIRLIVVAVILSLVVFRIVKYKWSETNAS